jgi:hypothetical protein
MTIYTSVITTEDSSLIKTVAPTLPVCPTEYQKNYHDQVNNILRLYFNQVDKLISQLRLGGNTTGIRLPYGAFQDSTSQAAGNTTTAYPITFNTTDYSNGVTLESSSHLKVTYAGLYNIQFSVQLENTTNAPVDIEIWFRKNGTNITASNSRFGLAARKNPGDPFHVIAGLNLIVDMQTNDYVELVWRTSDVGAGITAYAAGTSPTRPTIPSIITTMTFVSALP